jgi:hypothetical protein
MDNKVKERELTPLLAAAEKFKIDDCFILTDDQSAELSAGRLKIKVRPIWSWLLEKRRS